MSPPQGEASEGGEALVTSGTHTEMGGQRGEGGRVRSQSLSSELGVTPEGSELSLDPQHPSPPIPLALRALLYPSLEL